mmetsp:Transcript_51815/g.62433  ORF Transcript_51815/g.62433 Transcript_51815/m.62433 type:complete len:86 (+) Transcript_51815:523-780(+)
MQPRKRRLEIFHLFQKMLKLEFKPRLKMNRSRQRAFDNAIKNHPMAKILRDLRGKHLFSTAMPIIMGRTRSRTGNRMMKRMEGAW